MTRGDFIGGVTTFFTMSYIVAVNPMILCAAGTGMPFDGVLTATVLLTFSMTLLMGLYAKLPFAVAPGMGVNAFFAYGLVLGKKIPWPTALGMVFWAGVIFLLASLTPIREKLALAIPVNLRVSAPVGIGLFLCLIGLKDLGLVQGDPATLLKVGSFSAQNVVACLGLILGLIGIHRKSPFAFLGTILFISSVSWMMGWARLPSVWFSSPDFSSVFLKLDPWGALQWAFLPAIVTLFFTDLFDSISTLVGVSEATGLKSESGRPIRLREGLIVDAWATLSAGLFGSSSGTAYMESAAGIEAGGRTGKSALVTALCFLPCLFLAPALSGIPKLAAAPVLILVGALMFRSVGRVRLNGLEEVVPAFLTVALIPLSFSITRGILWGLVSHVILYVVVGRRKEVVASAYILALLAVILLALER